MFYVSKVSPECSFATGQLARHMHNPGEQHWEAMKRIIGYLKGKQKHELVITTPTNLRITSFGDVSFGDCKETRRAAQETSIDIMGVTCCCSGVKLSISSQLTL